MFKQPGQLANFVTFDFSRAEYAIAGLQASEDPTKCVSYLMMTNTKNYLETITSVKYAWPKRGRLSDSLWPYSLCHVSLTLEFENGS